MTKKVYEILDEELSHYKITKEERQIIIEDFEPRWADTREEFIIDYKRKPNQEEIREFVKEFLSSNVKEEKAPLRQQKFL